MIDVGAKHMYPLMDREMDGSISLSVIAQASFVFILKWVNFQGCFDKLKWQDCVYAYILGKESRDQSLATYTYMMGKSQMHVYCCIYPMKCVYWQSMSQ